MKDLLEEKILSNVKNAYINNELYEYLVGLGNYKIEVGDFFYTGMNDMSLMQKGINTFLKKNIDINLNVFINQSLLELLNSNDISKILVVLDFLVYYVRFIKRDKILYDIDIGKILPLLKQKILEFKQIMLEIPDKNVGNVWEKVDSQCSLYEMRTGHRIL